MSAHPMANPASPVRTMTATVQTIIPDTGWLESELVVPAHRTRAAGVRKLVAAMAAAAGADERAVGDLQLAVSEVCTAVTGVESPSARLAFRREPNRIRLDVSVEPPARFELSELAKQTLQGVGLPAVIAPGRVLVAVPI